MKPYFPTSPSLQKLLEFLFSNWQMNKKLPVIITPYHWPDLDGIACAYALTHLLKESGYQNVHPMIAQTPQEEALWVMNRHLIDFERIEKWIPERRGDEQVILVDTSDPKDLSPGFPLDQVRAVIDHRSYGDLRAFSSPCSCIEPVGSAATLITELCAIEERSLDILSTKLLYAAIMSNTIKCSTTNTTDRDRRAAKYLQSSIQLDEKSIDEMFLAKSNVEGALLFKKIDEDLSSKLYQIGSFSTAIAQLEIVGVEKLVIERAEELKGCLQQLKIARGAQKIFFIGIDLLVNKTFFFFEDEMMGSIVKSKIPYSQNSDYNWVDYRISRKEVIHALVNN